MSVGMLTICVAAKALRPFHAGEEAGKRAEIACEPYPASTGRPNLAKRAGSPLALIAMALACGASRSSTCASSGRPPSSSEALVAAAHARRRPPASTTAAGRA